MHFLRLIRPVNLLIIAATMYSLGWYFDIINQPSGESLMYSFQFFLLVFSTVMIAAAGNIINDYFDIRADRVNRPNKMVITHQIKRRWAIVYHWTINLVAFIIAGYLSYVNQTFWYVFIHLLSINLLWFYSMQLKRTVVVGNIIIALLTSLVPVLVGIFFDQQLDGKVSGSTYPFQLISSDHFYVYFGIGLGIFAFLLNWAREIVKDVEDKEGDKVIKAKTIPIVFGIAKAKQFTIILMVVTVVISSLLFWGYEAGYILNYTAFSPLVLSAVVMIITFIQLIRSKTIRDFKRVNNLLKITMIIGLLLPLFWCFQLIAK